MIKYPNSRKEFLVENMFGRNVEDSYRWMEDESNEHLKEWIDEQTKLTQSYLNEIEDKPAIKERLESLFNYGKYNELKIVGDYIIYEYNDGLKNQGVYYIQKGLDGKVQVLIDPNTLSEDGTVAVNLSGYSKDYKYLSYMESAAGSDWKVLKIIDLEKNEILDDELNWIKFTFVSWQDDGFYYSAFDAPEEGKVLSEKNKEMKVYYHKLGQNQKEDRLIYADSDHPLRYHTIFTTKDEKALIVSSREGTYGSQIKILSDTSDQEFKMAFEGFDTSQEYIGSKDEDAYFVSDDQAENKCIIKINTLTFEKTCVVEETSVSLESAFLVKGKLILIYLKDAKSVVKIHDLSGKYENTLELPAIGTPLYFTGSDSFDDIFYGFTSYIEPIGFYTFTFDNLDSKAFKTSNVSYDTSQFVTEQIFATSKDGTKVPAFISYKKGMNTSGDNPTMLYAYGGFNAALKPAYKPGTIYFIERGGIQVEAGIRGGSEYGEAWHKGGMLLNKQNVYDDFISVAEYLIENKYTSKEHLAISGRSNGGLLIGAVANQRPDLFAAAIPAVGVMDMMRYHRFTIGWGWVVEYGNPEEEVHFNNIIDYSPLHNIESKDYPAMLVFTADHDDRVVPAHSFKYMARLQELNTSENPVLIRIDKDSGHGAGISTEKLINEVADKFTFLFKFI